VKSLFSKYLESERISFKSNELLFRSADEVRFMHFIEIGEIKLVRYTSEGKAVITQLAKQGDLLAEASLFNQRYHCDGIAISDTKVDVYPKDQVLDLLIKKPKLAIEFIKFQSLEIKTLRNQVELINVLTARERILFFLRNSSVDGVYSLPGSLKNLASQIGLTHETLYRQIKKLEDEGEIKREKKKIILL